MNDSTVYRGAEVLDESGGFGPADIRVEDGVIAEVGHSLPARESTEVDLSGHWVMPGVVDCHSHSAGSSVDIGESVRTPATQWTLEAANNLRRVLEAGVTHLRDAGGADAGIRESVARGFVPGPSLQVSIIMLSQTGGHGDGYLAGIGFEGHADGAPPLPGRPPHLIDGPDSVRRVVRQILRAGADWVKICTTGGIVAPFDDPDAAELSLEDVVVAVGEAAGRGKGVMAHAFGGEGLTNAVRGGVRSIEHGNFLTEEQAVEMSLRGCVLVPTLFALRQVLLWAAQGGVLPPASERKARALAPRLTGEHVAIAHAHGVKIALGSDFVHRESHGRNLEEIALMGDAGLTAEQALLAATINGAELLGIADRHGRIARGYVFDAVLLCRDPSDLDVFMRRDTVAAVFKGGVRVGAGSVWPNVEIEF